MTIIKRDINNVLFQRGIGKFRTMYDLEYAIESWWYRSKDGLDKKTPNEVYMSGAEGRQRVYDFVIEETKEMNNER